MSTSLDRKAGWRRAVVTLIPAAMPLGMKQVFGATTRRFGTQRGYQAGFAIYWATCWVLAGVLIGPRRLPAFWRRSEEGLPAPRPASAVALLAAPVGAIAMEFLPNARAAGPEAIAFAAGLGTTNALAEEVLWRGVPIDTFPDEPFRGWLWPAVGFAVWHLVPMSTRPITTRRRASVLAGAALIGMANGWIAQRTGSLGAVTTAHALTDSCGVRAARTFWLPQAS